MLMRAQSAASGTIWLMAFGSAWRPPSPSAMTTPIRDVTLASILASRSEARQRCSARRYVAAIATTRRRLTTVTAAGLFHVAAPIDADCLAGNEIAFEQREDAFPDLDLSTPPPEWRCLCDRAQFIVAGTRRRQNRSGRDRIDQDIVRRELQRERFGQRD